MKNLRKSDKMDLEAFFLPFFAEKIVSLIEFFHKSVEESEQISLEEFLLSLVDEIKDEVKKKK